MEHLQRQRWHAAEQLAAHELLDETYWADGSGARWVVGKPHDGNGRCEIIAGIFGSLIVHGDYELCRFASYSDKPDAWSRLLWMADCKDIEWYVMQKASIGLCRQEVEDYDEDVAREYLKQRGREELECVDPDQDLLGLLREAQEHVDSKDELHRFLAEQMHRWDAWEWRPGRVLSFRVVVSHVALNRCAWLLRARYGKAGPPACRSKVQAA